MQDVYKRQEEFCGLFHDGEVGAKVGVKHLIKAQAAQGGNHLALDVGADRHAEAFAQSCTDGRSGLYHDIFLRIVDRCKDLVALIALCEGTRRAAHDALAAGNAGHLVQRTFKHTANVGIEPATVRSDHSHMLVGASGHAAAAEDALSIVADQILRRFIPLL